MITVVQLSIVGTASEVDASRIVQELERLEGVHWAVVDRDSGVITVRHSEVLLALLNEAVGKAGYEVSVA